MMRGVRRAFFFGLLALSAASSLAHDPYGLTATAYLRTNRVDLDVVMEFRTGLRLAGVEPRPPAGVSTTNWFAENRPALLAGGKTFCQIEAGTNLLPVRSIEVVLAVEDHIEFRVEYPPAPERPLRFAAAGLKKLTGQGQYGVALTVLDMVNGKVLGQPVLFADAPTLVAEIAAPVKLETNSPGQAATISTPGVAARPTNSPAASVADRKPVGKLFVWACIAGIVALLLLTILRQCNRAKS
jgi:hypothetical protein